MSCAHAHFERPPRVDGLRCLRCHAIVDYIEMGMTIDPDQAREVLARRGP